MSKIDKTYAKWNKYKIGNVPFIKAREKHPHRQSFIDYASEGFDSVVEVGPGEMLEYVALKKKNPNIKYTVVDVSKLFLDNCRQKYPEVQTVKSSIEDLQIDQQFDLVYVSSVIEHTKDVKIALKNIIQLADNFFLSMFKWNYDGNLKSVYQEKKKYWSSSFNIHMIFEFIESMADIRQCYVVDKETGEQINFSEYSIGLSGKHRSGNYLIIQGMKND